MRQGKWWGYHGAHVSKVKQRAATDLVRSQVAEPIICDVAPASSLRIDLHPKPPNQGLPDAGGDAHVDVEPGYQDLGNPLAPEPLLKPRVCEGTEYVLLKLSLLAGPGLGPQTRREVKTRRSADRPPVRVRGKCRPSLVWREASI